MTDVRNQMEMKKADNNKEVTYSLKRLNHDKLSIWVDFFPKFLCHSTFHRKEKNQRQSILRDSLDHVVMSLNRKLNYI